MASDERGSSLHGKMEFDERNIKALRSELVDMIKMHKNMAQRTMVFSRRLRDMAGLESFPELRDDLLALALAQESNARHQEELLCQRPEHLVILKLDELQEQMVKPTKMMLSDRDKSVKKFLKKSKGCCSQRSSEFKDLTKQIAHVESLVDHNLEMFEMERTKVMKGVLEDAVRAETAFHCRAVEALAPVAVGLRRLDPGRAGEALKADLTMSIRQSNGGNLHSDREQQRAEEDSLEGSLNSNLNITNEQKDDQDGVSVG